LTGAHSQFAEQRASALEQQALIDGLAFRPVGWVAATSSADKKEPALAEQAGETVRVSPERQSDDRMSVFFRLEIYDAKILYIKCDEIDRHEIVYQFHHT